MNDQISLKIIDPRLNDWGLPAYQSSGAAAIDLLACIDTRCEIHPQEKAALIGTGIAFDMRRTDIAALVLPRSGLGHKKGLVLGNTIGLIDSDYQGQVFVSAWNRNPDGDPIVIEPGERIAQLMFVPVLRPVFEIVSEISQTTARGAGGFGSTGI